MGGSIAATSDALGKRGGAIGWDGILGRVIWNLAISSADVDGDVS